MYFSDSRSVVRSGVSEMAGNVGIRLTKTEKKKTEYELKVTCLQAKVGNEKGFLVALQRLRGKDADISDEAAEIKVILSIFIVEIKLRWIFVVG